MNRPTPTPPRRGPGNARLPGKGTGKAPLLGGVGVGSESPCAREVSGGLSLARNEVLARPHSEMRPVVVIQLLKPMAPA